MDSFPEIVVINEKQRIGYATYRDDTVHKTLLNVTEHQCCQFYINGTTNYNCPSLPMEDIVKTAEYCSNTNTNFFLHAPHCINLAGRREVYHPSLKTLQAELDIVARFPASVVVHIGSTCGYGTIGDVQNRLNRLNVPRSKSYTNPYTLLLENSAGAGTQLGSSWEEIRKIYEGLDKTTVGICLDTQHTFGSGMNRLQSYDDVARLMDDCADNTGKLPSLIHLNDSEVQFGAKKDRHANLGEGFIWPRYQQVAHKDSPIQDLLDICFDQNISVILETPNCHDDTIKLMQYVDSKKEA